MGEMVRVKSGVEGRNHKDASERQRGLLVVLPRGLWALDRPLSRIEGAN